MKRSSVVVYMYVLISAVPVYSSSDLKIVYNEPAHEWDLEVAGKMANQQLVFSKVNNILHDENKIKTRG